MKGLIKIMILKKAALVTKGREFLKLRKGLSEGIRKRALIITISALYFSVSIPREFLLEEHKPSVDKIRNYMARLGVLPGQELFSGEETKFLQKSICIKVVGFKKSGKELILESYPEENCSKMVTILNQNLSKILFLSVARLSEVGVNNFEDDLARLRQDIKLEGISNYYCYKNRELLKVKVEVIVDLYDRKQKKTFKKVATVTNIWCEER
jgi:hypothetical protein